MTEKQGFSEKTLDELINSIPKQKVLEWEKGALIAEYISDTAYWQGKSVQKIAKDLKVSEDQVEAWFNGRFTFQDLCVLEDYLDVKIFNM